MRLFDVKGFTFHIIKWAKINIFVNFKGVLSLRINLQMYTLHESFQMTAAILASELLSIFSQNIKYLIPL